MTDEERIARARITVADHSRSAAECGMFLGMLGLMPGQIDKNVNNWVFPTGKQAIR